MFAMKNGKYDQYFVDINLILMLRDIIPEKNTLNSNKRRKKGKKFYLTEEMNEKYLHPDVMEIYLYLKIVTHNARLFSIV